MNKSRFVEFGSIDFTSLLPYYAHMSKTKCTLNMSKKAASRDWHRADIIAAVRKTGTNLQQMSLAQGYGRSTLRNALNHPAPKYERLLAEHLSQYKEHRGITAQQIWASRYHLDGSPKSGRGERGLGRYKAKHHKADGITLTKTRNVYGVDRSAT